jgi:hypothetical protein
MNNKIETNVQRIVRLLDGDSISDEAREYISTLVEVHGIEECSMFTANDQIGLSVFEDEWGEQTLYYGDYSDGRTSVDAGYCAIEHILDAAEGGDAVPAWWPDEATVIVVSSTSNGMGSRLTTKGCI